MWKLHTLQLTGMAIEVQVSVKFILNVQHKISQHQKAEIMVN